MRRFTQIVVLLSILIMAGESKGDVSGTWETGERFRAEILYEHGALPFPVSSDETEPSILSDQFPPEMQTAAVALRIYDIDEDGSETLVFEKLRMYRVFDSGNQSTSRVGIALGPDRTLVIGTFSTLVGKNTGSSSVRIAKEGDQFVVETYIYRGGESVRLYASNGSSQLISGPIECSVNLRTGQRTIDGRTDMIDPSGVVRLEDWSEETEYQLNLCPLE